MDLLTSDTQTTPFTHRSVIRIACLPPATLRTGPMWNQDTGFKIAVIVPPGGFPVIEVPPAQLERVRLLLVDHGIGHTLGGRLLRDDPDAAVTIHVGRLSDRHQIQDVLDRAP